MEDPPFVDYVSMRIYKAVKDQDKRGDPSYRWRVASVGKTGVFLAMMSLPDRSNEFKPEQDRRVE